MDSTYPRWGPLQKRRGATTISPRVHLIFTENLHTLELPRRHKFPLRKYDLLYAALAHEFSSRISLGARASWEDVTLVHAPDYVSAVKHGTLAPSAVRRLGFPWSEALVTRSLRSVGGTLAALAW